MQGIFKVTYHVWRIIKMKKVLLALLLVVVLVMSMASPAMAVPPDKPDKAKLQSTIMWEEVATWIYDGYDYTGIYCGTNELDPTLVTVDLESIDYSVGVEEVFSYHNDNIPVSALNVNVRRGVATLDFVVDDEDSDYYEEEVHLTWTFNPKDANFETNVERDYDGQVWIPESGFTLAHIITAKYSYGDIDFSDTDLTVTPTMSGSIFGYEYDYELDDGWIAEGSYVFVYDELLPPPPPL